MAEQNSLQQLQQGDYFFHCDLYDLADAYYDLAETQDFRCKKFGI